MDLLYIGLVLLALAAAGMLAGRMRQSAIPVYILVGLLLRPWVGAPEVVQFLGELGLILLMFFLGLEFSLPELLAAPGRTLRIGALDAVVNFPLGFLAALLAGWTVLPALVLGTALYVTSSAIVAKSMIDLQRTAHPETEVALRVLVFEDLAVAVLLGVLATIGGAGGDASEAWWRAAGAVGFVVGAVALGLWGGRIHRRIFEIPSDDLVVLTVIGLTLVLSWVSEQAGLSLAIGAFVGGLWVAETPARDRARDLLTPFYGPFAAFFFFAFGTRVEVSAFSDVWPFALVLVALGTVGKLVGGWWIARVEGLSRRARWTLGLTLIPRGEFSIVIAGTLATALGPRGTALIALVVLVLSGVGSVALYSAPAILARLTGEGVPADSAALRAETAQRTGTRSSPTSWPRH